MAHQTHREGCCFSLGMHFHVLVSKSLWLNKSRSLSVCISSYWLLKSLGREWQTARQMPRSWLETSNPTGGMLWDVDISQLLERNICTLIIRSNMGRSVCVCVCVCVHAHHTHRHTPPPTKWHSSSESDDSSVSRGTLRVVAPFGHL